MHGPRVVVFGYGNLAVAALDTLAQLGVAPVAVVVPSNRHGSGAVAMVVDVARARGHRVLTQPARSALGPFLDDVRALQPDLLLVWSYSMILPQALLDLPRLGAINVHGGLLPEYRGGHVMQWALINGERETGVTLHYMDAGIDTGPIIAQQRFPIAATDDAAAVQNHLMAAGQTLLRASWPDIATGAAPRVAQDEARARYYPMRTAEDGRIDWTRSNLAVYNLVRALVSPWPGAFTMVGGSTLVLRRVALADSMSRAAPGTVLRCDESGVRVATGDGDLEWLSVEIDGVRAGVTELQRAGLAEGIRL